MGDPVAQVLAVPLPFRARARSSTRPATVRWVLLVLGLVAAAVATDAGVDPRPAAAYPTPNVEIDGHGFGHGRGMGQYGALGYALNFGWTAGQILDHYYGNTAAGDIGNPEITVILSAFSGFDTVVTQERGHMVTNAAGGTFQALRAVKIGANAFRVDSGPNCDGPWTTLKASMPGPVVIQPQNRNEDRQEMLQGCEPGGAHRWFRGELRAVEGLDGGSRTVNALDVQGYLKGSVPREMPASWGDLGGGAGMNALRAQAVAARSYGWADNRAPYGKTCDTTACQVYGGRAVQTAAGFFDLEDSRSNRAVDETAGQVRTLNGATARTEYSSSTGGYTAGGTFPAVPDEGDAIAANPYHSWHVAIPVSRVQGAYPQLGTLNAVTVTRRNGLGDFGGRALEVQLEGSSGNVTLTGEQFQFAFDLRSNWFAIGGSAPAPGPAPSPAPGPARGPGNGPVAIRADGVILSAPDAAAVRGQDRVDVVARGVDGFYWTYWTGSGWTPWSGLGSPPGGAAGDPTFVSWAPGRLDVFVRGTDNKLWQTFSQNGGASWSGWVKPLGDDGELAAGPEASTRGPGRLDIFVLGTDNQIWQRFYDGAWNGGWLPQGRPSAGLKGEPGATSWDGNRVDVFARGGDDKLWQRSWTGSQWTDWAQPVGASGVLASSPEATSWGPGNLLVFVRGTDAGVWGLNFSSAGWGSWVRLAAAETQTPNAPGATARGVGRFDVFVRGTDDRVYQIWQ